MTEAEPPRSHLFTVRIWPAVENGRFEWRGRLQYVPTGEAHYFRDWSVFVTLIQRMLPDPNKPELESKK
jgi:hypothetical protein